MRNEIETKRNEINRNETKFTETKRNRNETKLTFNFCLVFTQEIVSFK
jgi:hypothetical protein